MLDDVEREHQTERLLRQVRRVEHAGVDAVAPRPVGRECIGRRFDAVRVAEALQRGEEQAVAAADVEDASESAGRGQPLDLASQQCFAGSPPPVALVQLAIDAKIPGVHQRG